MNRTADKKDFFYMVVLILTFVAVIIGTTIAIYYFLHKQEEGSSSVYTGTLSIKYLSGEKIDFNLLYPTDEPSYEDTENVYKNDFEVTNDGTLDSILTVNVVVNRNDFSDDVIQYKIFNSDGEELNKGVVNGKGEIKLCDNLILEHDNTSKFTIVMWLKETGKLQNEEMRKVLTGTIKVDANQKID